ncbi:MAG: hypothetical protein JSR27_05100 [Proteobacteria bacterium]|nr:hypothetical protein [Pseudomonadota bacterium]
MQYAHWIHQARQHWREFQPKKYKALKAAGSLEKALSEAAQQTANEMEQLKAEGFPQEAAWEMVREKYLFPPEETPEKEEETASADGYRTQLAVNRMMSNL